MIRLQVQQSYVIIIKKYLTIVVVIKLHSDDEHVTNTDKARWFEFIEGVGQERSGGSWLRMQKTH